MTVKQYYYKFGELSTQNIGTGNIEHQREIEKFLDNHKVDQFCKKGDRKTVIALSEDFHFAEDLKLKSI